MNRECIECKSNFRPSGARQRYCEKCGSPQNSARNIRRKKHELEFIGIDGEGYTDEHGVHHYVLLSVGDESLHKNGDDLTHDDIFTFLWDQFLARPNAVFVGFFLEYDFTYWLRSLSKSRALMLFDKGLIAKRRRLKSGGNPTPFPVKVGEEWNIDILNMKRFKLQPAGEKRWMYVCDAGSFYQSSFLNAINPTKWIDGAICTDEEYSIILEGKNRRATAILDDDMIRYNVTENRVLSSLMTRLNEGFVSNDIMLKRDQWYGPGQAAQEWLGLIRVPSSKTVYETVPPEAVEAGRGSYFGGWFEIMAHGKIPGETYEYDINSAYPAIMANLPCLLHGAWKHNDEMKEGDYILAYASVRGSDPHIGAMLHRNQSQSILRPHETRGWYWRHELCAADKAGLIDEYAFHEYWAYTPCDCRPPIGRIANLYKKRLAVGSDTASGKALKLVYNSCYGKFAQSVGSPKFANVFYASLITAGTRAMILDAIATHPNSTRDTLMVATDGVYFRTPHPTLPQSKDLGAWKESIKTNLTLFKPGTNWDDKGGRQKILNGESPDVRSRGVPMKAFAERLFEIDKQWESFDVNGEWPNVVVPISFSFIKPKQAIHWNRWDECGVMSTTKTRSVSGDPSLKRCKPYRDNDIIRSRPYPMGDRLKSTPYDKMMGEAKKELDDLQMPGGKEQPIQMDILDLL